MKVEEAIKILDYSRIQAGLTRDSAMMTESIQLLDNYIEACLMAMGALEKQIPKKPLPENEIYGNGICPNCGAYFMDKSTKFCGNCGQALDWNSNE